MVLVIYTGVTAYQAYLTRRALDASLTQQRAWLKVTLRDAGGLKITRGDVTGDVRVDVTNVGSVPAFGVIGIASIYGTADFGHDGQYVKLPAITKCGRTPIPASVGVTVFPGETVEVGPSAPTRVAREDLDDLRSGFGGQTKFTGFQVEACVKYRSSGSTVLHRTRENFLVRRKGEGLQAQSTFNLDGDTVERGGLEFPPSNAANEAD